MKKVISLLAAVLLACTCAAPAFAAAPGACVIGKESRDFSASWQLHAAGDGGKAGLTYGFNTRFFDEVYAQAKHSTQTHYAKLVDMSNNNAELDVGSHKAAGSTSYAEARRYVSIKRVAFQCRIS